MSDRYCHGSPQAAPRDALPFAPDEPSQTATHPRAAPKPNVSAAEDAEPFPAPEHANSLPRNRITGNCKTAPTFASPISSRISRCASFDRLFGPITLRDQPPQNRIQHDRRQAQIHHPLRLRHPHLEAHTQRLLARQSAFAPPLAPISRFSKTNSSPTDCHARFNSCTTIWTTDVRIASSMSVSSRAGHARPTSAQAEHPQSATPAPAQAPAAPPPPAAPSRIEQT